MGYSRAVRVSVLNPDKNELLFLNNVTSLLTYSAQGTFAEA